MTDSDHLGDPANRVASEHHGINPLEVVADALAVTHALIADGRLPEARRYLRGELERTLRYMCPICGKTGDHEDREHRFVAPHQRQLGG